MPGTRRLLTVKIASLVAAPAVAATSTELVPDSRFTDELKLPVASAVELVAVVVGVVAPVAIPDGDVDGCPRRGAAAHLVEVGLTVTEGRERLMGTSPPDTAEPSGSPSVNPIEAVVGSDP